MIRGARLHPVASAVAILSSLVNGSTMVLGATAIGWATDHLVLPAFDGDDVAGGVWSAAFLAIIGVSFLRLSTIVIRGVATGYMQFGAQADTRRAVTRQFLRLGLPWHRRHSSGQLLSNAVSDVEVLWQPMLNFAFSIGMVFMLLLAIVDLAFTDGGLALVALVFVPVVLAANIGYQRVIAPRARRAQQARAAVSSLANEAFEGTQVIRTLGIAAAEERRFDEATGELRRANTRMGFVSAVFDPVIELAPTVTVLVVLLVGSLRVADGDISTGTLVQVIYLLLTMALPLNVIGRFLSVLPLAVVGHERVSQVLDSSEFPAHGERAAADAAAAVAVSIDSAGHVYDTAPALADVSFEVEPGEIIAVVGATGSGKSTLLRLVARLLDAHRGSVRHDAVEVAAYSAEVIPSRVAIVPQTAFVFDDSVRGNVTLGRRIDDAEVWRALEVAAADGFVRALPEGLDAPVGEAGSGLSGGQRQRLALARALAGEPGLLVLDDATSALDAEVERDVVDGLRRHLGAQRPRAATVVIAASRASSVRLADRVVYLERGRAVAVGPHAELIARHPGYRAIVTAYDTTLDALSGRSADPDGEIRPTGRFGEGPENTKGAS
ncbi:ABC transporter ATP-binding protein [Microbacteriaceae bacterium VKM Ac-2855]|nr:ABC transporter ATP-binding protein [Microbacteriaceae bacterium VKM Ac-2855]